MTAFVHLSHMNVAAKSRVADANMTTEDNCDKDDGHWSYDSNGSDPAEVVSVSSYSDDGEEFENDYCCDPDENDDGSKAVDLVLTSFCSNHMMVNLERQYRGLGTLRRSGSMDRLSREHATNLASQCELSHSVHTIGELRDKLGVSGSMAVGENVQRGASIWSMHDVLFGENADCLPTGVTINRDNILNPSFTEFGMATAKGKDGNLYMVQLFREGPDVVRT